MLKTVTVRGDTGGRSGHEGWDIAADMSILEEEFNTAGYGSQVSQPGPTRISWIGPNFVLACRA